MPAKAFLFHQLSDSVATLRAARRFIFLSAGLFAAGYLIGARHSETVSPLIESFQSIAARLRGQSTFATMLLIFQRNVTASFLSLVSGAILGIFPGLAAAVNGVLAGAVISSGTALSSGSIVLALLPHGIFELPAMFCTWGLGIWLGSWPFRADRSEAFSLRMRNCLQVFFTCIVPLLICAALIEAIGISIVARHSP